MPGLMPNHMPPHACCPDSATTLPHPLQSTLSPAIVSRMQRLKIKCRRITKQAASLAPSPVASYQLPVVSCVLAVASWATELLHVGGGSKEGCWKILLCMLNAWGGKRVVPRVKYICWRHFREKAGHVYHTAIAHPACPCTLAVAT